MDREERSDSTAYGGLALAHLLTLKLGLDRAINERVGVLKLRMPYAESDHVLMHAYNLFVGGGCIQDLENLQESEAVRRMLGAKRLVDPTTAGDYLRRYGRGDLADLQAAIDEARRKAWSLLPKRLRRRATVDIDSHIKEVYGECKQGADFSYKKSWSYHPLLVTLAETTEALRLINRPGNVPSAQGAVRTLSGVFDLVSGSFERVYLRGDSKFCQAKIVDLCERKGVRFALVKEQSPNVRKRAVSLAEAAWRPFESHPEREAPARRRKRPRRRRRRAKARGYRNIRTVKEWFAEVPYMLSRCPGIFRLVILRKEIERRDGQGRLFRDFVYHYVLTNISGEEKDAAEVVRFAHKRCDQENAIEKTKNGLKGFRMPTGTLLANGVFLLAAQIAWCLKSWLSLLVLPDGALRWEWKAFRQAFVVATARVVRLSRDVVVRIAGSHRRSHQMVLAMTRLRSLPAT